MTKVYVVHSGDYSDRRIRGVFSDKQRAENFSQFLEGETIGQTEEWELDGEAIPSWYASGLRLFYCGQVFQGGSGNDEEIEVGPTWMQSEWQSIDLDSVRLSYHTRHSTLSTYCLARDEAHALKIAADRFAQWKAQQAGIA